MTIEEAKRKVSESPEYEFLRDMQKERQFVMLCIAGSYGYGTQTESSDIDVRGIFLHNMDELLLEQGKEQTTEMKTDTCVYSLPKALHLMSQCNPNVIEFLGLRRENYITDNELQDELIRNADMFLSKRAFFAFGGYARSQLTKLKEAQMYAIDSGKRNRYAIAHGKMGKHAMHLVRLYFMGIDILEKGEIITYREKEHSMLMDIRDGAYGFDENGMPNDNFFKLHEALEKRMSEACRNTKLPDEPDWERINKFLKEANLQTIRKEQI